MKEHENPNVEDTILTYQRLIGDLPKLNGQLLLYILDLLAVFAENSTQNLMPTSNLAAIFQPGLLSHLDHDMNPQEYKVSQEVLIFLIQHQDRFLPTTARKDPSPQQTPTQTQTRTQQPQPSKSVEQKIAAPPAKYGGSYPPAENPVPISRRRTFTKKSDSPIFANKVLRRHRSTRIPQSPRLGIEQEEPRRVSEGSTPTSPTIPIDEEEDPTPLIATFSRRKITEQPSAGHRESSFEEGREDGN